MQVQGHLGHTPRWKAPHLPPTPSSRPSSPGPTPAPCRLPHPASSLHPPARRRAGSRYGQCGLPSLQGGLQFLSLQAEGEGLSAWVTGCLSASHRRRAFSGLPTHVWAFLRETDARYWVFVFFCLCNRFLSQLGSFKKLVVLETF